ncbi:MAG: aminodeoxychorismate synthase component I [bacterium]|nr:aminodeoxychorismate synthase component I [bacterium]
MTPCIQQLDLELTPAQLFSRLKDELRQLVFLSSDGTVDSRWSILCWNPSLTLSSDGEKAFMNGAVSDRPFPELFAEELERRRTKVRSDLPFVGGAIGAIDYEAGYQFLGLPHTLTGKKLIEFSFYDQALLYDHQEKRWFAVGESIAEQVQNVVAENSSEVAEIQLSLVPAWSKEQYGSTFSKLKEFISLGEIYQACLTFPFFEDPSEDPRCLFSRLLSRNPAPMAAYLEQTERKILSLSPERFLHWDGKQLEAKPIKGTRPRGITPEEDDRLMRELLGDEKERAELNMITDLLRNDLARVSKPGTVQVQESCVVQACPTVWHTYSHITSQTKDGMTPWQIVEATFPGGSISGCPKRRAVEILPDLEGSDRGIYTGCIGYISDHGKMDLSIAIRTIEQYGGRLQASFGGGIVYDSIGECEYQECFDKAKNFLRL